MEGGSVHRHLTARELLRDESLQELFFGTAARGRTDGAVGEPARG